MGFYFGRLGAGFFDGRCSVSVVLGWALTYSLVTNRPLSEFLRTILVPPLAIGCPPWVKLFNWVFASRKCGNASVAITHFGYTQAEISFAQNARKKPLV